MKTKWIVSILVIIALVFSITATASMLIPAADKAKEKAKAPEKSPVITETDAGEWDLERVDFIHYAKPTCNNNGVCEPELGEKGNCADCKGGEEGPSKKCYKLMGIQWKTLPVDYVINPSNPEGLSDEFVINTITTSAETWDDETSAELFNSPTVDYTAQYGVQNFENAIVFGSDDPGIIGVTSVWYYRGRNRRIAEFDIRLNTYYDWGDAEVNPALMDLQNIATHELGHGVGLDDIYTDACSEVTMYGYSDYGDIGKRTLEPSDIAGIQKLYG